MLRMLTLVALCSVALSSPPRQNCDLVRCKQLNPYQCEKEGLQYVAKETVCGCCDYCQRYIPRHGACGPAIPAPGPCEPPKDCQPPSECTPAGVCKEKSD